MILKVEYDAKSQTLRLLEPLEGFSDGEQVTAVVNKLDPERPWMALANTMSGEDGEAFERAIQQDFRHQMIEGSRLLPEHEEGSRRLAEGVAVEGEYDAETQTLRLLEPLVGVEDHARVKAVMTPVDANEKGPWSELRGILSKEAGEELARAVEEMFPIEK